MAIRKSPDGSMVHPDTSILYHPYPSYVLFVALAGAPLPFGSRDPVTVALWCAILALGLCFAPLNHLRRGHFALLFGIGITIVCFAFVLHVQLASSPWIAAPNSIWVRASDALGTTLHPTVSIVRGEPFYALGAALAAVLSLMLGLIVGADRIRARQALLVMAWAGAGYATYGIFSLLFTPHNILWREKTAYIGNVTGTFINRNTAATYFGSCTVVWLVLLLWKVRGRLPVGHINWRTIVDQLMSDVDGNKKAVVPFSMMFLCLAALFLTGSRAGVILSLFALVITTAVFFYRDFPRMRGLLLIFATSGLLAVGLLEIMGGNVGARFDVGGLSDAGRFATYRSTLRMIADAPWYGTGLGTFAWNLPAYRSDDISMSGIWDIAHNTPLEFAAELGVPLTAAVGVGWITVFAILIRGATVRRRDAIVPLCALAVAFVGFTHSLVDFSLQVTGYTIVFFAVVGVGLGQSLGAPASKSLRPRQHSSPFS